MCLRDAPPLALLAATKQAAQGGNGGIRSRGQIASAANCNTKFYSFITSQVRTSKATEAGDLISKDRGLHQTLT